MVSGSDVTFTVTLKKEWEYYPSLDKIANKTKKIATSKDKERKESDEDRENKISNVFVMLQEKSRETILSIFYCVVVRELFQSVGKEELVKQVL